ncbi:unnamed protein product, partial [Discosporangium mesarthrocarpum]
MVCGRLLPIFRSDLGTPGERGVSQRSSPGFTSLFPFPPAKSSPLPLPRPAPLGNRARRGIQAAASTAIAGLFAYLTPLEDTGIGSRASWIAITALIVQ